MLFPSLQLSAGSDCNIIIVRLRSQSAGPLVYPTMKKTILILTIFTLSLDIIAQDDFVQKLDRASIEITKQIVTYDPGYFRMNLRAHLCQIIIF